MVNYMEELSVTEADNLKKTIAALFRQTCILQMKYDPVTLVPRDNLHYEICTRHRKFIEDYLSVLSCELVHDPQEHIYRLQGDGIAIEKINATVTKVILLVKLIYRDKILGEGLKATVTNLAEIREYGKNTNLINYKLTMGEWKEALYQWNGKNQELILDKELLRELSNFADSYGESSDFATVRQKVADVWIYMKTKLEAAKICMDAGLDMIITNGQKPDALYSILDNESIGTRFVAKKGA